MKLLRPLFSHLFDFTYIMSLGLYSLLLRHTSLIMVLRGVFSSFSLYLGQTVINETHTRLRIPMYLSFRGKSL